MTLTTKQNYLHTALGRGVVAFCDGEYLTNCPYVRGSLDWNAWREGYILAFEAHDRLDRANAITATDMRAVLASIETVQ